jgi:antitoxin component YwqK of YwqJK toxin-antitoxin module
MKILKIMKQLIVLLILLFPFVCEGQTNKVNYYQDIDYKDIVESKGLFYLKLDTTLVTGRVIRYNNKKEPKRYILVEKGKPQSVNWITFRNDYVPLPGRGALHIGVRIKDNMHGEGIISNRDPIPIKEKQDGLWEEYHENGKLKIQGNYLKGNRIKEWKYYNKKGKLKKTENYN